MKEKQYLQKQRTTSKIHQKIPIDCNVLRRADFNHMLLSVEIDAYTIGLPSDFQRGTL